MGIKNIRGEENSFLHRPLKQLEGNWQKLSSLSEKYPAYTKLPIY